MFSGFMGLRLSWYFSRSVSGKVSSGCYAAERWREKKTSAETTQQTNSELQDAATSTIRDYSARQVLATVYLR